MFRVSAKFKKKFKVWFLREVPFWLFWAVFDPETPPPEFCRKSALLLFSPISCSKSEQKYSEIQSVVIEKILFWLIWGVIDPETPSGGATRVFLKNPFGYFFYSSCLKFVQIFLKIQGVDIEKRAILAILGCY